MTNTHPFFRWAPWLLAALVLALLVPGTATLPLIDRDEPRFATATREMMERSDWIVPTFNGHERFDKPVLTYWLMRIGYGIFGLGELGARVHAILATLVLVLATWWIGRRWYGDVVGFLAGAVIASCLQVFIHGRLALADMPMIACVVLACVALKERLSPAEAGTPWYKSAAWWILYLALGFGFLAKGPIVFAVPVLGLLIFRFVLWRTPLPWSRLGIAQGLVLSLLIVASWGIPALIVTEGRFWKVGMGEHVVQRGYEKFNGRGYSPFFYLGTAPVSLFPWIAFVGLIPWIVQRTWSERTAWLVAWAVAPYLIFTAYATQLPHYVLPAFPALALLLAQALATRRAEWPRTALSIAWSFVLVLIAVLGAALYVVRVVALPAEVEPLRAAFTGTFLVLLSFINGAGLCLTALRRWAWLTLIPLVVGASLMGSSLRRTSITATSLTWVAGTPADTRFVGAGFSEPSLVFYTGKHWEFPPNAAGLADAVRQPGPLVVVVVLDETDPLEYFRVGLLQHFGKTAKPKVGQGPSEFAASLSTMESANGWKSRDAAGFNLGRTRWQHVRVWTRGVPETALSP